MGNNLVARVGFVCLLWAVTAAGAGAGAGGSSRGILVGNPNFSGSGTTWGCGNHHQGWLVVPKSPRSILIPLPDSHCCHPEEPLHSGILPILTIPFKSKENHTTPPSHSPIHPLPVFPVGL